MSIRPSSGNAFSGPWILLPGAAVLLVLFWALSAWLSSAARPEGDPVENARSEERMKAMAALRTEDAKKLNSFAWVDRTTGAVQIPIDLAMELVLPELQSVKPRPAYPVASPQHSPQPAAVQTKP